MRELLPAAIGALPLLIVLGLLLRRAFHDWRANTLAARRARLPAFMRDQIIGICDACEQSPSGHRVRTLAEVPFWKQPDLDDALDSHDWSRSARLRSWDPRLDCVAAYLLWCPTKATCSLLVRYSTASLEGQDQELRREVLEAEDGRQAWNAAPVIGEVHLPTST